MVDRTVPLSGKALNIEQGKAALSDHALVSLSCIYQMGSQKLREHGLRYSQAIGRWVLPWSHDALLGPWSFIVSIRTSHNSVETHLVVVRVTEWMAVLKPSVLEDPHLRFSPLA